MTLKWSALQLKVESQENASQALALLKPQFSLGERGPVTHINSWWKWLEPELGCLRWGADIWAEPSGWPQLFYLCAHHLLEDCWHRGLGGWDSLCPRDSPLLQVRDRCRIEHCGVWFLFLLNWRVFLYPAQVLFLKEGIAHRTSDTLWQHRDFCKALHKAVPCTYCPRMSSSGLQSHAALSVLGFSLKGRLPYHGGPFSQKVSLLSQTGF